MRQKETGIWWIIDLKAGKASLFIKHHSDTREFKVLYKGMKIKDIKIAFKRIKQGNSKCFAYNHFFFNNWNKMFKYQKRGYICNLLLSHSKH